MKKICVLLMALFLLPALACGEAYTIGEVREQVKELGRWTKTYTDDYGRKVEVDVAPIVPEAEKVPVLKADSPAITEENVYHVFPPESMEVTVRERAIDFTCSDQEKGEDVAIWISNPEGFTYPESEWGIGIDYRKHKPAKSTKNSEVILLKGVYCMPDEIDEEEPYLGESNFTVRQALAQAEERLSGFFPDYNMQLDLYRFGVTEATPPYYTLDVRQKMRGIPILQSAQSSVENGLSKETLGIAIPEEWRIYFNLSWGLFRYPAWCLETSDTKFSISCRPLKEAAVLADDVPLCGMDTILQTLGQRIEKGNIRSVYSLRFGYCCYFDENEEIVLYPVWQVECDYMFKPRENMQIYKEHMEGPVTTRLYYRPMIVNAQTGEFMDPLELRENLLDCPEIITWEDAK